MTENKRFTFADGFKIVAIRDNGEIMNSKEVCNKLNELAEENKSLKNKLEFFYELNKPYGIIIEENKKLKQSIKEVLELLEEEVDLFSDKATEHDINAYIELRELDNKDAYYMAISTKKAIKILKERI